MALIPDEPPVDGFTRQNSLLDYNRLQFDAGGHHQEATAAAPAVAEDDVYLCQ